MEIQQVNLGQVAFNPKGSWNADATYKRLNVVYYKGRSYYAKQDNTNQPPSMQSEYWGLMVDGGDVTNNPDEEDVTSMMDEDGKSVIKFADRAYDPDRFSGKGYKILRKNMQNVRLAVVTINVTKAPTADGELSVTINNIDTHITLSATDHNTTALTAQAIADALTTEHEDYDIEVTDSTVKLTRKFGEDVPASAYDVAATGMELTLEDSVKTVRRNIITQVMISKPNTIYEIRYDFDLNGGEITVPEGCTLKFEGGMLRNGELTLTNTYIQGISNIIFCDVKGIIKNDICVNWFGEDISLAFEKALALSSVNGSTTSYTGRNIRVYLLRGNYTFERTVYAKYCSTTIDFNNSTITSNADLDLLFSLYLVHQLKIINGNFFNCNKVFKIDTNNLDYSNIYIKYLSFDNCQLGIDTEGSNSTNMDISNCLSRNTKTFLKSYTDVCRLSSSWLYYPKKYYNSALIEVISGRFSVLDCLFVPLQGIDIKDNYSRYFDIYKSQFTAERCRFGGEPGSMPIAYCYDDSRNTSILIKNSFCDSVGTKNKAIVHFIKMPNITMFENITGIYDLEKLISLDETFDINNYVKKHNYIIIKDILHNGVWTSENMVPEILLPYTKSYIAPQYEYILDNIIPKEIHFSTDWGLIGKITQDNDVNVCFRVTTRRYLNVNPTELLIRIINSSNTNDMSKTTFVVYNIDETNAGKIDVSSLIKYYFNEDTNEIELYMRSYSVKQLTLNISSKRNFIIADDMNLKIKAFDKDVSLLKDFTVITKHGEYNFNYLNNFVSTGFTFYDEITDTFLTKTSKNTFLRLNDLKIYTTEQRLNLQHPVNYKIVYDETLNKFTYYKKDKWLDLQGNIVDAKKTGSSTARPQGVTIGFIYKDTDLNKLIVWDGDKWINLNGSPLV